jgi:hypothetical protein
MPCSPDFYFSKRKCGGELFRRFREKDAMVGNGGGNCLGVFGRKMRWLEMVEGIV